MLFSHTLIFFFFNDTATTEIYTLSLHDALPIWHRVPLPVVRRGNPDRRRPERAGHRPSSRHRHRAAAHLTDDVWRSEEHTSELQSRLHLVCRLLLEKKKTRYRRAATSSDRRGRDT